MSDNIEDQDISRQLLERYPLLEMDVKDGIPDNSRFLRFVVGEDEEIFLVRQSMVKGIRFFDIVFENNHKFVEMVHIDVKTFKHFMAFQKHQDLRQILFKVEAATRNLDVYGNNHGFTKYLVTLAKLVVFCDMYDVQRLGDHLSFILTDTCFPHTINLHTFGALRQAPMIFKYLRRNVLRSHPVMVQMVHRIRNLEPQYRYMFRRL